MMFAVLLISVIIFVASGDGALPADSDAWWALTAVSIVFATSIVTFYIGISYVGGPRGALIMNNEPVVTIFIAVLLLGEVLAPLQYVGAAIVIAAVLLVSLERPTATAR
jgi:drug/metabolite transporter (DMT)-like permease